jgi:cytochrome c peroxidase
MRRVLNAGIPALLSLQPPASAHHRIHCRHLPDRTNQVAMMAQMQNIIDFPPAPKLDPFGRLDPALASQQEPAGERVHDLKLERFYKPGQTFNDMVELPEGPIKTFTLRGIKDTPPYLHDSRLMTLADTVEFFNLVLGTKLTQDEKNDLVAYMLAL